MRLEKGERNSAGKKPGSKLLQSYILSLLSLTLCFAMFLNATSAWFTSEVETPSAAINVGNLEVDLQDATTGKSLGSAVAAAPFSEVYQPDPDTSTSTSTPSATSNSSESGEAAKATGHWMPGAIAVAKLNVVNKGDIPFNFELNLFAYDKYDNKITDFAADDNKVLYMLANYFTVWYRDDTPVTSEDGGDASALSETKSSDPSDIRKEIEAILYPDSTSSGTTTEKTSDWTRAGGTNGTLATLLAQNQMDGSVYAEKVISGTVSQEDINSVKNTDGTSSTTTKDFTRTYTVVLYMDKNASMNVMVDENGNTVPLLKTTKGNEVGYTVQSESSEEEASNQDAVDAKDVISLEGQVMYIGVRLLAQQMSSTDDGAGFESRINENDTTGNSE